MRITITQIIDVQRECCILSFTSPIGGVSAQWVGALPDVGTEYDVEIEIPGVLKWGQEIAGTASNANSITQENGQIVIKAGLQSIGGDGVAVIQFYDNVMLVETDRVPNLIPSSVQIKIPFIRLFDANL